MIHLTKKNNWHECTDLPIGDINRNFLRATINAFLTNTIPPRIRKCQYDNLIAKTNKTIQLDDQILSLSFVPFPDDDTDGRLRLIP